MPKIKPRSLKGLLISLSKAKKGKRWKSAYLISERIIKRKPYSKRPYDIPFEVKATEIRLHKPDKRKKSYFIVL